MIGLAAITSFRKLKCLFIGRIILKECGRIFKDEIAFNAVFILKTIPPINRPCYMKVSEISFYRLLYENAYTFKESAFQSYFYIIFELSLLL